MSFATRYQTHHHRGVRLIYWLTWIRNDARLDAPDLGAGPHDANALGTIAFGDDLIGNPQTVEDFHGSWLHTICSRGRRKLRVFVDDPAGNVTAAKLAGTISPTGPAPTINTSVWFMATAL